MPTFDNNITVSSKNRRGVSPREKEMLENYRDLILACDDTAEELKRLGFSEDANAFEKQLSKYTSKDYLKQQVSKGGVHNISQNAKKEGMRGIMPALIAEPIGIVIGVIAGFLGTRNKTWSKTQKNWSMVGGGVAGFFLSGILMLPFFKKMNEQFQKYDALRAEEVSQVETNLENMNKSLSGLLSVYQEKIDFCLQGHPHSRTSSMTRYAPAQVSSKVEVVKMQKSNVDDAGHSI